MAVNHRLFLQRDTVDTSIELELKPSFSEASWELLYIRQYQIYEVIITSCTACWFNLAGSLPWAQFDLGLVNDVEEPCPNIQARSACMNAPLQDRHLCRSAVVGAVAHQRHCAGCCQPAQHNSRFCRLVVYSHCIRISSRICRLHGDTCVCVCGVLRYALACSQARLQLEREVLDLLSTRVPSDTAQRTPSKLSQTSAAAQIENGSNCNSRSTALAHQHLSALDGEKGTKADKDATYAPVFPNSRGSRNGSSTASITQTWLADVTGRAHDATGVEGAWAHCRAAARVRQAQVNVWTAC